MKRKTFAFFSILFTFAKIYVSFFIYLLDCIFFYSSSPCPWPCEPEKEQSKQSGALEKKKRKNKLAVKHYLQTQSRCATKKTKTMEKNTGDPEYLAIRPREHIFQTTFRTKKELIEEFGPPIRNPLTQLTPNYSVRMLNLMKEAERKMSKISSFIRRLRINSKLIYGKELLINVVMTNDRPTQHVVNYCSYKSAVFRHEVRVGKRLNKCLTLYYSYIGNGLHFFVIPETFSRAIYIEKLNKVHFAGEKVITKDKVFFEYQASQKEEEKVFVDLIQSYGLASVLEAKRQFEEINISDFVCIVDYEAFLFAQNKSRYIELYMIVDLNQEDVDNSNMLSNYIRKHKIAIESGELVAPKAVVFFINGYSHRLPWIRPDISMKIEFDPETKFSSTYGVFSTALSGMN